MKRHERERGGESGFSLIELMVAMAVTLIISAAACSLILGALNVRTRESRRSDALADAQRALYVMSREIAAAGFGLNNNGIVAADSGLDSVRVRANLNAFERRVTSNAVTDNDEDLKYLLYSGGGESYIIRLDVNTGARTTILANRVDSLRIRYYADKVNYSASNCDITAAGGAAEVAQKGDARYIVIALCVRLPAVGKPGSTGYQPASSVQLTSDVTLRNADLLQY